MSGTLTTLPGTASTPQKRSKWCAAPDTRSLSIAATANTACGEPQKQMKKRLHKSSGGKTLQELEATTRDLDREFILDSFGTMTPEAATAWERARRKQREKGNAAGTRKVSVTIDRDLLRRADRTAKRLKVSRSWLVKVTLERALNAVEKAEATSEPKRRKTKPAA